MELILKQDVENLGFKDDVVQVKNGYGRNFFDSAGLSNFSDPFGQKSIGRKPQATRFQRAKVG